MEFTSKFHIIDDVVVLSYRNYYAVMAAQQAAQQRAVLTGRQADGTLPTSTCYLNYPLPSPVVQTTPTRPVVAVARPPVTFNDEEEGVDCSPCFSNDTFR